MTGRRPAVLALLALALLAGGSGAVAATPDAPTQLLRIKDPRVIESSGLATGVALPEVLWTVNDSGDRPRVYGIGSDGSTVATLTLRGARARDWEAVAVSPRAGGGAWLWIGDIGDNRSSWPTVRVYRVVEPSALGARDVSWQAYELRYPDGPRDAEALLVDPRDGRLYVVSKRVQGAAVYRAPPELRRDRVNVLERVASAPPLVTDGSFAPDGRVALRDYLQAFLAPQLGARAARLTLPLQPQGEGLTWAADGSALVVSSEGRNSVVWRVPVPSAARPTASSAVPGTDVSPSVAPSAPGATPDDRGSSGLSPVWLTALAGLVIGGGIASAQAGRRKRTQQRAVDDTDPT